jgi:hypothetical protein
MDNVTAMQCGGDGVYVSGADANAGTSTNLDCRGNGGWGLREESFLGNRWLGIHTASNTLGPVCCYKDSANNDFVGVYTEGGQPPNDIQSVGSTWFGGADGVGFTAASTCQRVDYKGIGAKASATLSAPSFYIASDPTTGFSQIGTASGVWAWGSLGSEHARFGSGFIKTSTNGTYWSSAQKASEFVQTVATLQTSMDYAKSASYTGMGKWVRADTAAGTGFSLFTGTNAGGDCFKVLGNGNVQNTNNSYGAISDLKLKQDIADASSAWDKIKGYRWVTYSLKADPDGGKLLGLIAQEAEVVSPGVVYETPDFEEVDGERVATGTSTKAVKYSVIAMQCAQALGEALKRIEALEAEILTLKGA